ncbi:hypothetical protein GF336_04910 [Candidatus Woesearchaeota archaeon]|nr:hypothetical protein [Candidatus Woesearchaeota archaeon]
MAKTQLSALEIHYLLKELGILLNSKLDKIYHPKKKEIILQLHVPNKGKHTLTISPTAIFLAKTKPFIGEPSDLCMYLRKKLKNARLRSISQPDFERIVSFNFENKQGRFNLLVEMFSTGNIILLKDNKILTAAEYQNWSNRTIKPREEYIYPAKEHNFLEIKKPELKKLLSSTKKDSLVKSLAIDLSLGGTYAEELCILSGIEKSKKPSELEEKDISSLFENIKKIRTKKLSPKTVIQKDKTVDITPFKLKYYSDLKQKKADSFNKALDDYFSKKKTSEKKAVQEKKLDRIKNIIQSQKDTIKKLESDIKENKAKADKIYENYQLIDSLLKELKQISKKHSWKDIQKKLKDHKLIKQVNPKDKTIVVELR